MVAVLWFSKSIVIVVVRFERKVQENVDNK